MTSTAKLEQMARAAHIFSPGAPINKYQLFAGRVHQIRDVINAAMQRGQHVILFGERGVGKTSLANVLSEILSQAGLQVMGSGTINCDGTDNFTTLWRKAFREIQINVPASIIGFASEPTEERTRLEKLLPEEVSPDDVRFLLQHLAEEVIIIIDEVDRLSNRHITTLLADTIKTLSDHSVGSTLVLVGVADSVDELIAEHESIERCLVQVRMPRMSVEELSEILTKSLNALDMTMDNEVKRQIVALSQGLPHYTHLLGLHAVQAAINEDREEVTMDDFFRAIHIAVDKAQRSIRRAHHRATSSARETLYAEVLLACALAKTDDLGYFAAADVREPMSAIMGKPYKIPAFARHLKAFCEEERGPVLQRIGSPRRYRYRFMNPLMEPFVILDGLARELVNRDTLIGLSAEYAARTS